MFSFETADSIQIPLIRNLASNIWGNTYKSILSKEQLDYMFEMMYSEESLGKQISEKGHCFFIAKADGIPVGFLSIESQGERLFIFQKIYALPEMQGKGLGRYMVEQAIHYLRQQQPPPFTIELYVNRENSAVDFYLHLGFKQVATRDHHIGNGYYMNDYIMQLPVNN